MKKYVSIALAAIMVVGCFTGCGSNSTQKKEKAQYVMDSILNEPGVFPIVKEEYKDTTITIGLAQSTLITSYDDNTFTQALEEKLGCNIEFELLPSANSKQKIELMIAAGGEDLPDILITKLSDGQVAAYGQNGTIVDLSPYYENSSYYLQQMFDYEMENYNNNVEKLISLSDGSMYYIPRYLKSLQNEYPAKMWMYEPWLEKLGLEKPTTLSEFKEVLTAFKEQDPNGNGKADEMPLTGFKTDKLIQFILSSFVPVQTVTDYIYIDEDGKATAAFMTDEWKMGLEYLNELYNEGLLSDTKFTQDYNQFNAIKSTASVILGTFVDLSPSHTGELSERTLDYTYIEPLKNGSDGVSRSVWVPTEPIVGMVVTKNCEHPELAFRLGDLMCNEEMTIWNRWGEKGVDWLEPEEGTKGLFDEMGYKAKIHAVLAWGTATNHHWEQAGPGYRDYDIALGTTASDANYASIQVAKALPSYDKAKYENTQIKYIYDVDKYSSVSEYQSSIKTYVEEQMALFITGYRKFDSDWDDYLAQLKTLGVEEYVKLAQEAYDNYVKE